MNTQRRGSDLKTHIRIALSSLGYDPNVDLSRFAIVQLEEVLTNLRKEQTKVGGILKEILDNHKKTEAR